MNGSVGPVDASGGFPSDLVRACTSVGRGLIVDAEQRRHPRWEGAPIGDHTDGGSTQKTCDSVAVGGPV
jgi:hypothetical protein